MFQDDQSRIAARSPGGDLEYQWEAKGQQTLKDGHPCLHASLSGTAVCGIDAAAIQGRCAQYSEVWHGTTRDALIAVLVDGALMPAPAASTGFIEGVLARESLEAAATSSYKWGVIIAANLCYTGGSYLNYSVARHRAYEMNAEDWSWRAILLQEPGVVLRRKERFHAPALYTFHKSIELAGFAIRTWLIPTLHKHWKRHFAGTRPRPERPLQAP